MKRTLRTSLATFAAAALVLTAGQAFADGTGAATAIANTANVEFTIGGVPSGPVPSNTVTFQVDHKINVVVAGAPNVNVIAGGTSYALPFTVTNLSNTAGDAATWFKLTTVELGSDNFDMTGVEIWQDTDANGTPDVNLTAAAILAGDTAVYIQLTVDQFKNIMIVANTPNNATTRTPGQTAQYDLVAQAWTTGDDAGVFLAEDTNGNDPTLSEIVWADGQGTTAADGAAPDGIHSATGTYTTTTPIAVVKGASNGTSGYQIPGDVVTYTVTVTNSAATNATAVRIYDGIPANTFYSATTLSCNASGAGVGGTPEWSIDGGTNYVAVEPAAATVTHVRCDNGTAVAAGGTVTLAFGVVIQ